MADETTAGGDAPIRDGQFAEAADAAPEAPPDPPLTLDEVTRQCAHVVGLALAKLAPQLPPLHTVLVFTVDANLTFRFVPCLGDPNTTALCGVFSRASTEIHEMQRRLDGVSIDPRIVSLVEALVQRRLAQIGTGTPGGGTGA